MRFALVNPAWDFAGSTYFGCQEQHFPLELMYAAQQVRAAGHEALLLDAHADRFSTAKAAAMVHAFDPDFLVIPTAPSYLFWRCPQPELRVPQAWFAALAGRAKQVAIGPHGSATPAAVFKKLGCDVVLRGEPDLTLAQLAFCDWREIDGCCFDGHLSQTFAVADLQRLGALDFSGYNVESHSHRHHVFHGEGRGAELEFSRGCPWACSFCNKTLFRNKFRERKVEDVLQEVDQLVARGVDYIYFIDEIFGAGRSVKALLRGLAGRPISIGIQTRIDLWDEESLELLAQAGCISMECGIESITDAGRDQLNKNCRLGTDRLSDLLVYSRQRIPWVQANLILTEEDDREDIRRWQQRMKSHGVWVSEPVPMFPFPGSPLYQQTFGAPPDEHAWERAHDFYLAAFRGRGFSDIQSQSPAPLAELERPA